jgi:hypothetical protein
MRPRGGTFNDKHVDVHGWCILDARIDLFEPHVTGSMTRQERPDLRIHSYYLTTQRFNFKVLAFTMNAVISKMLPEYSRWLLILLIVLLGLALFLLALPYTGILADQVSGITVKARFRGSWPPDNSSLELQHTSTAKGGKPSVEQQLQQEFNCSGQDFAKDTSCSLADASRYFVCNRRSPRTGAFVAGSSAWEAYDNCGVKPGIKPGACLFKQQQQQQRTQISNNASMNARVTMTKSLNGSSTRRRLQQTQQQQHKQKQQAQQEQHQTQYIVILGDSQGMHYTEAVVRGLQDAGAMCNMQKQESGAAYFGDPAYRQQDCSGCSSSLTRCTHPATQVQLMGLTYSNCSISAVQYLQLLSRQYPVLH